VERIHPYAVGCGERAQQAARLECHIVRGAVLHLERLRLIVAVVEESRHLVQLLVECAAESDVHLLETTADTEHRHAGLDGLAYERQRRGIARRIVQRARVARGSLIVMRLDVRGAAGKQQPIEPLEQLSEAQLFGERRDQQRRGARSLHYRARVLLPDHVKRVHADHTPVCRNAY